MVATSAGILLYRLDEAGAVSVLIAHMGGPYWAGKDEGAWSIPKGEIETGESAIGAARREFREELGVDPPEGPYSELGAFAYPSGKRVIVFAADGSGFSADEFVFGTFELEWPPRSGRLQSFAEVDRVEWMPAAIARTRLVTGQRPAIDRLVETARAGG